MSKIPSIIEQELNNLNPAGLDEAFISRLSACAEDSFTELSSEEMDFEKQLRVIRPRGIRESFFTELQDATENTPFAVDEKIVLFNKASQSRVAGNKDKRRNIIRFNIAAAAAVALLGALSAMIIPGASPKSSTIVAADPQTKMASPLPPTRSNITPASYNRNLSDTSDEGVIWLDNNTQPYRVFSQTYMDRVTTENVNGEFIELEKPCVEHVLIPEKID
jgi:hypothetical protein